MRGVYVLKVFNLIRLSDLGIVFIIVVIMLDLY